MIKFANLFTFVFAFLISCSFATAQQEFKKPVQTPCAQSKEALVYTSYGIDQTKFAGWECSVITYPAAPGELSVLWKKGEQKLHFTEDKLEPFDRDKISKGLVENVQTPEPMKTLRVIVEGYLGDPRFAKRNAESAAWVAKSITTTRALLFSPNNERILVYEIGRVKPVKIKGKEVTSQGVQIYKKGQADKLLSVVGLNCSPDEFFSLVINPVIQ